MEKILTVDDIKTINDLVKVNDFVRKFKDHSLEEIMTTPQFGSVTSSDAPLINLIFDGEKMGGKRATVLYHKTIEKEDIINSNHTEEDMIKR